MTGAVAKRYARALLSLLGGDDERLAVGGELAALAQAFRDANASAALGGGVLDVAARGRLAARIAQSGVSKRVGDFVGVLAANGRLDALEAIEREYRALVDRRLGRVRARVRSAQPLGEQSLASIVAAFERTIGKKVLAEVEVDPALLGGVVVEIEGKVYDGSTRRQLERLRATLAG